MKELFCELKALKGGDVGIQIDIFGNCYIYRSAPLAGNIDRLPAYFELANAGKKTNGKQEATNENNFICMHA